jgi:hypothetical protein
LLLSSNFSVDFVREASDLPLVLSVVLVGSAGVSVAADVELSVVSVDLLGDDGSVEEVSREEALSVRRGAGSAVEVGVVLAAAVLLSTSVPNWSFAVPCERAGFGGAVWTDTLAATSDVTLATDTPLEMHSGQEVSKERASLVSPIFI